MKSPSERAPVSDGQAAAWRVLTWRHKEVYQTFWKYGKHAIGPLQAVLDRIGLKITTHRAIQPKMKFDEYPANIHRAVKRLKEYRQSMPPRRNKAGGSGAPATVPPRRMQGKWPRRFKEICVFLHAASVPCPTDWTHQVQTAAAAAAAAAVGGCMNERTFKGVTRAQATAAPGLSVLRVSSGGGLKISATSTIPQQRAGRNNRPPAARPAAATAHDAAAAAAAASAANAAAAAAAAASAANAAAAAAAAASKAPAAAPTARSPSQGPRGWKRKAEGAREEAGGDRRRGGSEEEEQGEAGLGGKSHEGEGEDVGADSGCGRERVGKGRAGGGKGKEVGGRGKEGGGRGKEGGGRGKEGVGKGKEGGGKGNEGGAKGKDESRKAKEGGGKANEGDGKANKGGAKGKDGGEESKLGPWYCKTKAERKTRTTVNLAVKATKEKLCEIGERAEEADRQMVEARRVLVEKYWGILKAELKKGEQEERCVLAEVAARGEARLARRVAYLNRLMDDRE
ncbi:hypothetical protein CLOM_g2314 [Closterium sp. NIES-68]|nr:hypothetical protein CLOM_g2314 [Closterium sp. NIES-68]